MRVSLDLLVFLTVAIVLVQAAVLSPREGDEEHKGAGKIQPKRDSKQQEPVKKLTQVATPQQGQVEKTKLEEVKQAIYAKQVADDLNALSNAESANEGNIRDKRQFGYGGYPGFGYGFPGYGFGYDRRRSKHRGRGYFGGFGGRDRSSESFEWDD